MSEPWHPTEGAAYRAVHLVMQGKCAKEIAIELYGHYRPTELQRVVSLLKFAAKDKKILKIRTPIKEDLQLRLEESFPGPVQFHVVNNDHQAYVEKPDADETFRTDAVCRKAAEIFYTRLHALLTDKHRDPAKPVIVANAGGLTVSRVVHFLDEQKHLPVIANPSRLRFISLNSAAMPSDYNRSSNSLAVRMAEQFGGEHMAVTHIWPPADKKKYEHAVRHIDLLLCGAGAGDGILFQWLKDYADITLPAGAVGDLCLIPITSEGDPVPLDKQAPKRVREVLNPHPAFEDLQALAARDGVILVAVGNPLDERKPDYNDPKRPLHSKFAVTQAILRHTLARTCILGTTLARDLLQATTPLKP